MGVRLAAAMHDGNDRKHAHAARAEAERTRADVGQRLLERPITWVVVKQLHNVDNTRHVRLTTCQWPCQHLVKFTFSIIN